jgi:hypothetical protein
MLGLGTAVRLGFGLISLGPVCFGKAVMVRFGTVSLSWARRSGSGKICLGMESYGAERRSWFGSVWTGRLWSVKAVMFRCGEIGSGQVRFVMARGAVMARRGTIC